MNTNSPNVKPEITPANFPALRSFLRGYFHEDVADEYGTPVDAADQFCEDAESDERNAVANEWTLLMAPGKAAAGDQPGINRETRRRGSSE